MLISGTPPGAAAERRSPHRCSSIVSDMLQKPPKGRTTDLAGTMSSTYENPFTLPAKEIFDIREEERQRRAEERERVKTLRVWEKTTAASRVRRGRRRWDSDDDAQVTDHGKGARTRSLSSTTAFNATDTMGREVRREKENVADFVHQKREMFLVQMSLQVKKAEILKLDEKARHKQEALKQSRKMLDEDVTRFDAFLQGNDEQAHQATKDVEEKMKIRQEKIATIKHLKSQLSAVNSEITKYRDMKDECLKYKDFLVKLTPPEWKLQKDEEKLERKRNRKEDWVRREMAEIEANIQRECDEQEAEEALLQAAAAKPKRRQRRDPAEEAAEKEREALQRRNRITKKYRDREQVASEYREVSSEEEHPLYFQEPKQLLDIFTKLEEKNLFLIQNSQDTEQALEELDQKYRDAQKQQGFKNKGMKKQIQELEHAIAAERELAEEARQKVNAKKGGTEHEALIAEMTEKVAEVFALFVEKADQDQDTLTMLSSIESHLELLLDDLNQATLEGYGSFVEGAEQEKEKERRSKVRKMRVARSAAKIRERLQKALKRSEAPVHKKVGKQVMYRSAPNHQARRVVVEDNFVGEARKDHDRFGIWLNRDGVPHEGAPASTTS